MRSTPITVRSSLLRKTCATSVWLLLSAGILDCGSAPEVYVPSPPSQPIPMDGTTYAWIGKQALAEYGYDEIIKRGVDAGFLRYPDSEKKNTENFIGQSLADAASQAWPVFTQGAVMAFLTSQVDSPAPGPADAIAIGMLVVAIANAGSVAAMVLTSSTTATATPIPTTTAPPIATPTTTTTAPPIATPTTTTTAPPIPLPRKYPNQTCDNARLKTLEKLKAVACDGQKWTCRDTFERLGKPGEKLLTCAEILSRIVIGTGCVAARKQIQTECYAGSPDPAHEQKIEEALNAVAECVRKAAIRGPGGGPCKP